MNKFFLSINIILCFGASILSIAPAVQEKQPRSGLLQASVVTLYVTYLTWSALSNQPDRSCNPRLGEILAPGNKKAPNHSMISTITDFMCRFEASVWNQL
jgi:serine incorporator 1/3